MAQFELGKKDEWMTNFSKPGDLSLYNEAAVKRFEKMKSKFKK
jgi:hypothetical protein